LTARALASSNGIVVKSVRRLLRDDSGATAVEYSLIIGGIATVIIVVVYALGAKMNKLYGNAANWP
jgi:Flp pilus assembly pilin Flp